MKGILEKPDIGNKTVRFKLCEALDIIRATSSYYSQCLPEGVVSRVSYLNTMPMDESLVKIVRNYGEKILLRECDKAPKTSKKKGKKRSSVIVDSREKRLDDIGDWQGPSPWDLSLGGDGYPKFLCDVMVSKLFHAHIFLPVMALNEYYPSLCRRIFCINHLFFIFSLWKVDLYYFVYSVIVRLIKHCSG